METIDKMSTFAILGLPEIFSDKEEKKMKKRSFAILIVLAMLLCLVPVTAFAAEGYGIMVGSTEFTTAN